MVKLSPFSKGLLIVLAAVILVGSIIFANRILLGDSFTKEEAQHALYAYWLSRDIQNSDWANFWYDTQRQMVWPFLHSWLLSGFFLFFGVSYISARLLSLLMFFVSIILIYLLSHKLCGKKGWRVGIIAALLALTSPIMIRFATENMIEGLGALLFMAAAYIYFLSEERKITIEYVIVALLIGLSVYTNYLYAYLLIPAFVAMTIVRLIPLFLGAIKLKKMGEKHALQFIWWSYRKLIVLGFILLFSGIWFSFYFSRKILLLFNSIFKYSGGVEVQGLLQNLLYYPKVIVQELSFSPWIGLFLLVSLLYFSLARRYRGLGRIYVYVWVVLLLLALTIPVKAPQMLYIVIPFIFVIFGAAMVYLYDLFEKKSKNLAFGLILLLFLPAVLSLPRAIGVFFPLRGEHNLIQVMNYFKENIPVNANLASRLNLKRLNAEAIRFHFRDWQGRLAVDEHLTEAELIERDGYYLTIDLDEESHYQREIVDDSLLRWNRWLRQSEADGLIRLYSTQRFESIGLTAKIYKASSF